MKLIMFTVMVIVGFFVRKTLKKVHVNLSLCILHVKQQCVLCVDIFCYSEEHCV